MRANIFFLWLIFFSLQIGAVESRIGLVGTIQSENSINQVEVGARQSFGLIAEWPLNALSIVGELRKGEYQSSSGGLKVKSENLEALIWIRHAIFEMDSGLLLIQGGLGMKRAEIQYQLINVGNSRQSALEAFIGIGSGFQFFISKVWRGEIVYQILSRNFVPFQQAGSLAILYQF